jgi:dTDP-4-amino-4,6-dideoxygalactose transaminase
VKKREYNYKLYRENLEKFYWTPKQTDNQNVISNMGYPMILPDRDAVSKSLMEAGVEHRPLVSGRMSNQPMWIKKYGEKSKTGFSNKVDDNGIYLPNNHEIKDEEILHICSIVNNEARDI